jgi:hypothetical protein
MVDKRHIKLTSTQSVPIRYLPQNISKKDRKKQTANLRKSRKLYKKGVYYSRPKIASFHSKPSGHVQNAMKMYNVDKVRPDTTLARKTGCSVRGLKQIVKKGEGAYFSSGSRPNQTAQSWGYARLASAITGAGASVVDFSILEKECSPNSRALRLARKTRKNRS